MQIFIIYLIIMAFITLLICEEIRLGYSNDWLTLWSISYAGCDTVSYPPVK